jgi:YD repeat-containing protein
MTRLNWTFTMRLIAALAAMILIAALYALVRPHLAHAQTFRDASGRLTGTATRDSNGTTTFRDGSGRMTGTATRDANGTTTIRDGDGRMIGTAERLSRPTPCAIAQYCMNSKGGWESWK